MHLSKLCALALAAEAAYGYLDTSPFFMFSTSELLSSTTKLQSASSITSEISNTLSQCPSDFYIVVSQEGVTASDYRSGKSTPILAHNLVSNPSSRTRSSVSIPEVVGELKPEIWQALLSSKCGVQTTEIDPSTGTIPTNYNKLPHLITLSFSAPSQDKAGRHQELAHNDALLASILDLLPSSRRYTVIYTTSPAGAKRRTKPTAAEASNEDAMDSEMQDTLHMDLKRDTAGSSLHEFARRNNQTMIDGPLFDKYQFFTPGIFMGFLVGFILLSILYVAIYGVASLQVSYAAFDKESGPLAAKKQQ